MMNMAVSPAEKRATPEELLVVPRAVNKGLSYAEEGM